MKSLWLQNRRLTYRTDIPTPKPDKGEGLVAVDLAGICGTDLELLAGYYPFIGVPGHEFVGRIIDAPKNLERVGQRVVGEINVGCQNCAACQSGRWRQCLDRSVLGIKNCDGAFAEFLCLPLKNLLPVPEEVTDEAAVFSEPLAAAMRIQDQITISAQTRVLIIGAGRLGQLAARVIQQQDCQLQVAVRRRHERQQTLLRRHGIDSVLESDVETGVYDLVIEASGHPSGWRLSRMAVRPQGTIVLKSTYHGNVSVNLSSIVVDEVIIVGSRCGSIETALKTIESGRIDPSDMIEKRYSLKEGKRALEHAARPGTLKIMLEPGMDA